tara:strand:- start:110 stop:355 length:246 start_codon:yes stop_codon:yes gene_type:complete
MKELRYMSGKLEHALKQLSDALATLEASMAEDSMTKRPATIEFAASDDSVKQHIHDIEIMMTEAIALLEQATAKQAPAGDI